jgi:DNA-binding GntR family transcriptional regulator
MAAVEESLEFERGNGSRAELAYLRLREQIIRTELAPGTVLREDDLTRLLGTGRTPVREALQRLQRDGFVTVLPRRGTLVAEINITDLAAIYEVRMRIESWASRLAAERVTEPDRIEARALSDELAAVAGDDYEALLTLDRRVRQERVPGRDARPVPQPLAADPARGDEALPRSDAAPGVRRARAAHGARRDRPRRR